jgi:hypothetical protein
MAQRIVWKAICSGARDEHSHFIVDQLVATGSQIIAQRVQLLLGSDGARNDPSVRACAQHSDLARRSQKKTSGAANFGSAAPLAQLQRRSITA